MTVEEEPLYHDFTALGWTNKQLPGIFAPNQRVKAPVIEGYIERALASVTRSGREATFVELFCADAYYAMYARSRGAVRAMGIDSDRDGHLASAVRARAKLGLHEVEFRTLDIRQLPEVESFTIVANVGGLYHVENPEAVLDWSYSICDRYLIVQTVVSMANDDPDYFETPAPGMSWGSRHSRASFEAMIDRRGWNVLDRQFRVLEANERPADRGSLFYLIERT
jgi:hypothetical protein